MSLPVPNLDDLRFQQDLVDEARRRIIHYCPEWTDYNLSDPGITLIELFAWMTEMIVYRLNRVPEKNHIKFLELLGLQLQPASSARAELTFRLSTPFPIGPDDDTVAIVPQGIEVATQQTEDESEVIFTTNRRLTILPPRMTQIRRDKEFHKNYVDQLDMDTFLAFDSTKPAIGDTFYLGFDADDDISGHILRLTFHCEPTQGTGVRRQDPPLTWECLVGDNLWEEVAPSKRHDEEDTTGGLNNPQGNLVLYLPLSMQPSEVNGVRAYWVRCRFEQRHEDQGKYDSSPHITYVAAHALGATTWATHAVIVKDELLGYSNGEPGQGFRLQNTPVLSLQADESVEVEEKRFDEWVFVPWERVSDFSNSDHFDRHFTIDMASGEVQFGPAIRQSNGAVEQYGRVPQAGRAIRFSQYRYGGGVTGNVPVGKIQVLKTAIPYIDQVYNLKRAAGGRDQETLDEAKIRAQRELRAQLRAVTPEDYEDLAKQATRGVARVKCNIPQNSNGRLPAGVVEILVVPAVADSLRVGDLSKLHIEEDLIKTIEGHLDKYRLLTTTLRIREPKYVGIKVQAQIVPAEFSQPEQVRARVVESLRRFISPLAISENTVDVFDDAWDGWPFGRNLYVAEIFSSIQRVPGVKHVLDVSLNKRRVIPRDELPDEGEDQSSRKKLDPVKQNVIRVPADTLLCSLDHEVILAELEEDADD